MSGQKARVVDYFQSPESRWGYSLLLKGNKHFGFYPMGQEHLSMADAQYLMEAKLGEDLGLAEGAVVLDAGCGEGNVAVHLAREKGWRVVGVDLMEESMRKAQTKAAELRGGFVLLCVGNYSGLGFGDNTFDGVYTMETLVHADDYRLVLKEFYRVLRPGGKLALFEYTLLPEVEQESKWKWFVDLVVKGAAMPSLPAFGHDSFPGILESMGFSAVKVENLTERVLPMLKRFHLLASVAYPLIKLLGWQDKFVNATFAQEWYQPIVEHDLWRYVAVQAQKPGG